MPNDFILAILLVIIAILVFFGIVASVIAYLKRKK